MARTETVEPIRSGGIRVWRGDELVSATCGTCKTLIEAIGLVSSKSHKGGRMLRCLPCSRKRGKAHYSANSESVREKVRTHYASSVDQQRERVKTYYAKNRDARLDYHTGYRTENAELRRARMADYAKRNPNVRRAWRESAQGRASKAASTGSRRAKIRENNCGCVSAEALLQLWQVSGGVCVYCEAPAEHYDHVEPLARGGRHCIDNLALACASCNLRKGAKTLSEFLAMVREPA